MTNFPVVLPLIFTHNRVKHRFKESLNIRNHNRKFKHILLNVLQEIPSPLLHIDISGQCDNPFNLKGKIIGMKSHYRFSFIPIFKTDEVKNTLSSLRAITSLKYRLDSHKPRVILYNPDYPKLCTHGHRFTMLLEFISMVLISVFLIVLGLNSIAMFFNH